MAAAAETVLALRRVGVDRTLAFLHKAVLALRGDGMLATKGITILEGLLAKLIAQRYPDAKVTGLDASADAIEGAKKETPAVPANLTFQVADFNEFEAPQESYDIILFTRSLHHVHDMPKAVEKAHQLLKKNGVVALQEFAREKMDKETARWLFDRLELLELSGVWLNHKKRGQHSLPPKKDHEIGQHGGEKQQHGHSHEHKAEYGHSHEHGHGKEEKKGSEEKHGHVHEHKSEPVHAHGPHGQRHGHNHEGAPDLTNWREMAKSDPMKLWADFHWHAVPLSTGKEMIAAMQKVFGAVHYQEPITPYLYFYAEHGMKSHAEQATTPYAPGMHLNIFLAFLQQELVMLGDKPGTMIGLNIAAQKKASA